MPIKSYSPELMVMPVYSMEDRGHASCILGSLCAFGFLWCERRTSLNPGNQITCWKMRLCLVERKIISGLASCATAIVHDNHQPNKSLLALLCPLGPF